MNGVLMGPQRDTDALSDVMAVLRVKEPIALVTAGWQEREDQDRQIDAQLGGKTVNLRLHARAEQVFAEDPDYAALHRTRQDRLRHRQEYYRVRLARAADATLEIKRISAGSAYADEEEQLSLENIRRLDDEHLAQCRETRLEFENRVRPFERPAIAKQREELRKILEGTPTIAIAGGHVAVLLNRMRMFGVADLLADQTLIAWAGGAMVSGDRVVLFHESPPHGVGVSEVMDDGLGLHTGILPLPNPRLRLKLDDTFRVGWMARRNAPARCVAFDYGEWVCFSGRRWFNPSGTTLLKPDGALSTTWAPKRSWAEQ